MKNKKGFTLIELLAVIVILGLLMAIAIPSVTKYITQSRKKTLSNTISNYASALTNQVNDMEYTFTETNTIYAVPIECVALERGGTDPFGYWLHANNGYWAYVLVQYDDITSSYTYGFTFKDSAGYGLYPTSMEKLKENGSQIQQDLDLNRPRTGLFSTITGINNWSGFELKYDTRLVVLTATSENEKGDGKNTCTLAQKTTGYDIAEAEKADTSKPCTATGILTGDVVTCGSEQFYIIETDSRTVTALAKHKIDITTDKPKQNANASASTYSDDLYWIAANYKFKPEFTTANNFEFKSGHHEYAFTYGNYPGNLIYKYVDAYRKYLVEELNVESAGTTLLSRTKMVDKLGCPNNKCDSSPYSSWLYTGYYWFLGTCENSSNIYVMHETTKELALGVANGLFPFGVRPVVIIAKDDIQFAS